MRLFNTKSWVLFLFVASAAFVVVLRSFREPSFEGKTLSTWLMGFDKCRVTVGADPASEAPEACRAIRAMGVDALPALTSMLSGKDSSFKRSLIEFSDQQSLIRIPIKEAAVFRNRAAMGFVALGSAAAPAIPRIRKLLRDADTAGTAIIALAGTGAVLPLAEALTDTECPEKARAMIAFTLVAATTNQNEILPALIGALEDPSWNVRRSAGFSLSRLHPDPVLVMPALLKALKETNSMVLVQTIRALANLGPPAKEAVPALVEIGTRRIVPRAEVLEALKKIDPESLDR